MTPAGGRRGKGGTAGRAADGPGVRAGSFRRGFRNTNPLVLVVALALLLPALLGLEYFFTSGAWSDVALKYWLRKSSDDYVYVSWVVGRNKNDPPDEPTIYLLGGSTVRESITSNDTLEASIQDEGGPDTEVYNLGSMNQNFAQSLAVVDNIPDTPATVIVGINNGRFTPSRGDNQKQAEGREFLLKSTFLRTYVNEESGKYRYTYTILPGIFSYVTSYAQEHQDELLSGEIPTRTYGLHRYNLKGNHSVAQKERMVERWNKRRAPIFRKNLDYNMAMLEELLKRAEQRGIDVVLLELPSNREIIGDDFDDARALYQPRVQGLADEYGVPYVDFNAELPLTNADFHDLSHLVEPGRVVWEARLAEELARLLGADGALAPTAPGEGADAKVAAAP
jgi:hypothetical protein